MAINPITLTQKTKSGGGMLGSIIGGTVGALGAAYTGGASIGIGAKLGEAVGETAKPGETTSGRGLPSLENARKLDPNVQLAALTDARRAAARLPKNQSDEVIGNFIDPAIEHLRRLG